MKDQDVINKTIVVTYDDITRMKDFCTNKGEGVTKDFMDWYVNDNAFFSKIGILICENVINGSPRKFVVSFDFNNPDMPKFVMYDYVKQKPVCRYTFSREDNLSMKDIKVNITWIDLDFFKQADSIFISNEVHDDMKSDYSKEDSKFEADIKKMNKQQLMSRMKEVRNHTKNLKNQAKKLEKKIEDIQYKIAIFMAEQGVYFTYATMYYFAKNKAKEVTGTGQNEVLSEGKQIKALYKYTGYVNLADAKVYIPVIKKDGPTREYGRHIEKWSVRGHYRRVGDKTIWIEPFEKGEGELEKRIYGTEKESEVNVIPKVFEVTRTVPQSEKYQLQYNPGNLDHKESTPARIPLEITSRMRTPEEQDKLMNPGRSKPTNIWTKIASFFTNLIGRSK